MRIGIDIDDTITNTYEVIIKLLSEHYGISYDELYNKHYDYKVLIKMYDEYFEIFKENMNELALNLELKDNVKEIIDKLSEDNEIHFITARTNFEYIDCYTTSKMFLDKNNIKYDSLNVGIKDKGEFLSENNIDILIDDSEEKCMSAIEHNKDYLLFDSAYNKESNLKRVMNWKEVYEYIRRCNNG